MSTSDAKRKQLATIIDEALRKAAYEGTTASAVAKALGVNPATVSTWRNVNRRALPSRDNLAKLARFLNLPLEHFDVERTKRGGSEVQESNAPVFGLSGSVTDDDQLRTLRAVLEAWRKADARAERYHALLLNAEKPPKAETLGGLKERLLAAVVARTADPAVYAVVVGAWEEATVDDG